MSVAVKRLNSSESVMHRSTAGNHFQISSLSAPHLTCSTGNLIFTRSKGLDSSDDSRWKGMKTTRPTPVLSDFLDTTQPTSSQVRLLGGWLGVKSGTEGKLSLVPPPTTNLSLSGPSPLLSKNLQWKREGWVEGEKPPPPPPPPRAWPGDTMVSSNSSGQPH